MKKQLYFFLIFITSIALANSSSDLKKQTIEVNGILRTFYVYQPQNISKTEKTPLLFVLHGGGGNAEGMVKLADFRPIANREKVVLVYPEGMYENWNDNRPTESNLKGIDDIQFFSKMIDYMILTFSVEKTKVYATGISNGAIFSARLAAELSDKISAIALVAGSIEKETYLNFNSKRAIPVLMINGTSDKFVRIQGGKMTKGAGGELVSNQEAIEKFVALNNCNPNPEIINIPDIEKDGTTVIKSTYKNLITKHEVVNFIIKNGGHTWPSGKKYLPKFIIGKTCQDINACEEIWAFFKEVSKSTL